MIDTQPDVHDFIKEHIPEAVYFNENHFRTFQINQPTHYSPPDCIQSLFRSMGLPSDTPVVVYSGNGGFSGWGDGLEQTMTAYSLARFGVQTIYLLNGGIEAWVQEGYELSKDFPRKERSTVSVSVQHDLFITYHQLLEEKDSSGTLLIDVRPRAVYEGKSLWNKQGHIPGAINLPWRLFFDHNNPRLLRTEEFIRELAEEQNAYPDKQIILYCGTGREATAAFLVFKHLLNYPTVKLYEGSFTEWCSFPENSTVIGPHPY